MGNAYRPVLQCAHRDLGALPKVRQRDARLHEADPGDHAQARRPRVRMRPADLHPPRTIEHQRTEHHQGLTRSMKAATIRSTGNAHAYMLT